MIAATDSELFLATNTLRGAGGAKPPETARGGDPAAGEGLDAPSLRPSLDLTEYRGSNENPDDSSGGCYGP